MAVAMELNYAPWWVRVLAALVDRLIPLAVVIAGAVAEYQLRAHECLTVNPDFSIGPYCASGNSVAGVAVWVGSLVFAVGFSVWNSGYRQGTTGSSIGKQVMKIRLLGEKTGQPIGFGPAVLRIFAHIADSAVCYVGWLFPLWDPKKQTLADKIMKSVCVRPGSGPR